MKYVIRATNLVVASSEDAAMLSTGHTIVRQLPNDARTPETEEDFDALNAEPTPDISEWYQRTPGLGSSNDVPQVGTIERLGSDYYVCFVAQTNVGGVMVNYFAPDALNGGWRRIALDGGLDPWGPGPYALDAEVLYEPDSTEWRNRRPNNSQAFAPPVSGSGWMQIGPGDGPFPWKHVGNEGVPLGWFNTHNGKLWESLIAANFWEPQAGLPSIWADRGPA